MERTALARLEKQFERLERQHLPDAPVERVAVLQDGDDPGIEPGQLLAQIFIQAAGDSAERIRAQS